MTQFPHHDDEAASGPLQLRELVAAWADRTPDKRALVFLDDGDTESDSISYVELHRRAQAMARHLRDMDLVGERVLLLFPSCIEYVVGFLGCLYAGVIAVPLYPPRNNYHAERVAAIAVDADARAALTLSALHSDVATRLGAVGANGIASVVSLDALDLSVPGWHNDETAPGHVAYLQYTSGSTGTPKGVMVRHADVVRNSALHRAAAGLADGELTVSWLPIFHDLGLLQGIVLPLTAGGTAVFMPPAAFIQQPLRWLRTIDRYRAVMSGGPNFAYDLCVEKIRDEQLSPLDLSTWRIAANCAEPISLHTMRDFARKFAACGFRDDALCSAFGLAEATLYVASGRPGVPEPFLFLDKEALARDEVVVLDEQYPRAQPFMSSGIVLNDPQVRIVDAASGRVCAPGRVGEIWLAGSSVCVGYWNRPQATEETFGALLSDAPGVRFMRTGDLGFVHDGNLYITGRLKDLIIIRGANHYPQDIEHTAERVSPALRKGGCGAAFTVDDHRGQQLVVVQEVERTARRTMDVKRTGHLIAQAVAEAHGIDVHTVVLLDPGNVPKTSSGKIQRKACRQMFLDSEFKEIGRWQRPSAAVLQAPSGLQAAGSQGRSDREALVAWLRGVLADLIGAPLEDVSSDRSFASFGLDSIKVVELVAEIGSALGASIPPTIAFEYPTIARLADYLAGLPDRPSSETVSAHEPIAVIGMECRFPQADGVDAFWQLLLEGHSAVTEISPARKRLTGFDAGPQDAFRWGGFLADIDRFDATLFGISAREARSIDPQQRILLETVWRALESAHIAPTSLGGSATGVFVGISANDYADLQRDAGGHWDVHSGTGSALSIAANRVSYCLGLQGPSLAIDTACSSSLVAVHQACRSLAARETHLCLAGGVNLILSTDCGKIFSQAQMLSPSGRCGTFDDAADGYVRSEGCGVVVLKRLADAQRDGDRILAVIGGSAVNQDGHSNGLTAPNGLAQQRVIRSALKSAGWSAESIGYVETHGTGTPLGDPIEVRALRAVLDAPVSNPAAPCWLGAVKTNLGHLEPAAGMAGLIKSVLVLQHGVVPPNCHFGRLNRHIDLGDSRLSVPLQAVTWPAPAEHPRRAGVSSFGFGGTNAHVVLEAHAAPATPTCDPAPADDEPALLLTLSAHSEVSLHSLGRLYAQELQAHPDAARALCCNTGARRARLPQRLSVAGRDAAELAAGLETLMRGDTQLAPNVSRSHAHRRPHVAFLFSGQGAQRAGMGEALYRREPVFRRHVDRCDSLLAARLGVSIRDVMFGSQQHLLANTRFAQPALVTLELGLVEQWRHWGVEPAFVVGHSIGEAAAACVAGLMDLETVLHLVAERGRLMSAASGHGAMLSVRADAEATRDALQQLWETVDLAAVNAVDQIVLAGESAAIDAVEAELAHKGLDTTRLKVEYAFHSRLMVPILDEFAAVLAGVRLQAPHLRLVPSGGPLGAAMDCADYWVNQLVAPVRFADAMREVVALGADTFVEIGPDATLIGLGRRTVADGLWLASLSARQPDGLQMRSTAGALFVHGTELQFQRMDDHRPCAWTALPSYPFDREAYWFERDRQAGSRSLAANKGMLPLLGKPLDLAVQGLTCFEAVLPGANQFLLDHRVAGRVLMPGAGHASLMLAAARQARLALPAEPLALHELRFHRACDLGEGAVRVQTLLQRAEGDAPAWQARVLAWNEASAEWDLCASAGLQPAAAVQGEPGASMPPASTEAAAQTYRDLSAWGLDYGPQFRALTGVTQVDGAAFGTVMLPAGLAPLPSGALHPVLLDAAFHALAGLLRERNSASGVVPLPVGIDSLTQFRDCGTALQIEARVRGPAGGGATARADLLLRDTEGRLVASVSGLMLSWVGARSLAEQAQAPVQTFAIEWRPHPAEKADARQTARRWMLLHEDECEPAFSEQLAGRGITIAGSFALEQADADRLSLAFRPCAGPAGLVVQLADDTLLQAASDSVDRCVALCRKLQRVLLSLHSASGLPSETKVCVVTRGANTGHSLAHAAAAGMLRSAQLEHPPFALVHVDMAADTTPHDIDTLARTLLGSDEPAVAISGAKALVPRLSAVATDEISSRQAPRIRSDASYLVSGGTGGLGLQLVQWLAEAGARHIDLVGRRAELDETALRCFASLRERGVEVQVHRADLGRPADVQQLMERLAENPLPLRGVIHGSGVIDDRPLSDIDHASWMRVMDAKLRAAWLIEQLTDQFKFELDFSMAFSSIAAVFGSAGQANYAAANAALDALMQARRRRGASGITIHWGPWAEVGMASDSALAGRLRRQGLPPMRAPQALRALTGVLERGDEQSLVLCLDAQRFASSLPDGASVAVLRDLIDGVTANARTPAPELPTIEALARLSGVEASQAVLLGLGCLMAEVLQVDAQREFADLQRFAELQVSALGVDSLMAMELRSRVRGWVGIDLPAHLLIGGGRVAEVAEVIHQNVLMRCLSPTNDGDADVLGEAQDTEVFVL